MTIESVSLRRWLLPTLLGPWLSLWSAASLFAAFGPEPRLGGRVALWVLLLLFGSLLAFSFTLVQVLVDVALLALRVARLSTGQSAWAQAVLGPLLVVGSYVLVSPIDLYRYGPWVVAAGLVVPIVVSTLAMRLVVGPRLAKVLRKDDRDVDVR